MFTPVEIKWDGETYTVPSDETLGLIDLIEDHVTLDELHRMQYTGNVKRMQVAKAYAAAVNYAIRADGAKEKNVSPKDVYDLMYREGQALTSTISTVYGLIAILLPPEELQSKVGEVDEDEGKPQAASDS